MATLKVISLTAAGIIGTGGVGSTGAYAATMTTIEKYLKDDLLDEASVEDWKALQKKLNEKQNIDEYSNLGLEAIKGTETTNLTEGNSIKNWCRGKYNERINPTISFLPWSNQKLLSTITTFCIRLIEEKLGDQKINLDEESVLDQKFKTKFETLTNHNNENQNGKLDDYLENLKTKDKASKENWEKLKNWCGMAYKRGFKKEDDNLWKLVQYYCKNS